MDRSTVDRLLTTTRAVRKRLDLRRPVERGVVEECLEIAIQAPTGGNLARYHFVVVTDAGRRAGLAALYRQVYVEEYVDRRRQVRAPFPEAEEAFFASAGYLTEHLSEVPVHVIPCVEGRAEHQGAAAQAALYGSILPAAWSFMLALRARGLGACWTTLHLRREREAAALLGIPADVTQAALIPVAYHTGVEFSPARRVPARERTHWEAWRRTP